MWKEIILLLLLCCGTFWARAQGAEKGFKELALGVEINAVTDGEPTGQGAILLGGGSLGRRF
jgi:hypothetical protein